MKIKIKGTSSALHYDFENIEKYEKLGFMIETVTSNDIDLITNRLEKPYFKIEGNPEIEINSIEELFELSKSIRKALILEINGTILIYDDYIE